MASVDNPITLILNTELTNKTDLDANCAFWESVGYELPGFFSRLIEHKSSETD